MVRKVPDEERGRLRSASGRRHHVLVAGGGVAAMEAVLALRALGTDHVAITLLAPGAELLYRPVTVAEAFGRGEARTFRISDILADQGVEHLRDTLARVRPISRSVLTGSGDELSYDSLIVAVGARQAPVLPGALNFGGRADVPGLRRILDELVAGQARSVAFTLTGAQEWPIPLYELTLLTAEHLREHASRARVTLVTPEERPLALFGPEADRAVSEMLSVLGVRARYSAMPSFIRPHELVLAGGGAVAADRVVTLPGLEGPHLDGLPTDDRGFIPVDGHGRVPGVPGVYAAGDVTAFPLKQGGLAAQEADAVAAQIAHAAGAPVRPERFAPVLRGLLMTAGAPLYLRCEPQRLERRSSVAIDDRRAGAHVAGAPVSVASDQALWWPPAKIAGRYLAPHLATAEPLTFAAAPLQDRRPESGPPVSDAEFGDAVELALLLADGDADWGDYRAALASLDAAEALQGTLPPEYEAKRRLWLAELRGGGSG